MKLACTWKIVAGVKMLLKISSCKNILPRVP